MEDIELVRIRYKNLYYGTFFYDRPYVKMALATQAQLDLPVHEIVVDREYIQNETLLSQEYNKSYWTYPILCPLRVKLMKEYNKPCLYLSPDVFLTEQAIQKINYYITHQGEFVLDTTEVGHLFNKTERYQDQFDLHYHCRYTNEQYQKTLLKVDSILSPLYYVYPQKLLSLGDVKILKSNSEFLDKSNVTLLSPEVSDYVNALFSYYKGKNPSTTESYSEEDTYIMYG